MLLPVIYLRNNRTQILVPGEYVEEQPFTMWQTWGLLQKVKATNVAVNQFTALFHVWRPVKCLFVTFVLWSTYRVRSVSASGSTSAAFVNSTSRSTSTSASVRLVCDNNVVKCHIQCAVVRHDVLWLGKKRWEKRKDVIGVNLPVWVVSSYLNCRLCVRHWDHVLYRSRNKWSYCWPYEISNKVDNATYCPKY